MRCAARHAARMSAVVATALLTAIAPSGIGADITLVPPGTTAEIDAHDECHLVQNNNAAGLMVPHRLATEWVSGGASFLQNTPANVVVSPCPSITPNPDTGALFADIRCHDQDSVPFCGTGVTPSGNMRFIATTTSTRVIRVFELDSSGFSEVSTIPGPSSGTLWLPIPASFVSNDGQVVSYIEYNFNDQRNTRIHFLRRTSATTATNIGTFNAGWSVPLAGNGDGQYANYRGRIFRITPSAVTELPVSGPPPGRDALGRNCRWPGRAVRMVRVP